MLFKAEFGDGSEIQREDLIEFNFALKGLNFKPVSVSMFDGENIVIVNLSDFNIYVGDNDKEDDLDLDLTEKEKNWLVFNGCVPVIFNRVTIHRGSDGGNMESERVPVIGFKSNDRVIKDSELLDESVSLIEKEPISIKKPFVVERYAALKDGVVELWKHR